MTDLVIFTCKGREHLLRKTFQSFKNKCDFEFNKTILAIDGPISQKVIDFIQPDIIVQSYDRKGYVNNITSALKQVSSTYFFWLEDDWAFNTEIKPAYYAEILNKHPDWAEIVLSKTGALEQGAKVNNLLEDNLYINMHGFSANPCICNTKALQSAFNLLEKAPKGDKLGEDGFENFLTRLFEKNGQVCVIEDPVDHLPIAHEGYLESTPRNWHMTNSLEEKTKAHLLTLPQPTAIRKLAMIPKLTIAFTRLSLKQMFSDKVYELCFRIIASAKTIDKDE